MRHKHRHNHRFNKACSLLLCAAAIGAAVYYLYRVFSSHSPATTTGSSSLYDALDHITYLHTGLIQSTDQWIPVLLHQQATYGQGVYANTSTIEGAWSDILGVPPSDGTVLDGYTNLNLHGNPLPIGLTSAVPLGGLGAGNYEIRADGTMHLSTIRNQAIIGEPWQGIVDGFLMAVRVNGATYAVRVGQPTFYGLPSVPQLVYSGLFPSSRLQFLNLTLYMYSSITPSNMNTSVSPTVAYSLRSSDPTAEISLMVMMPMGIRRAWRQTQSSSIIAEMVDSASDCAQLCTTGCYTWQYEADTQTCRGDTRYSSGANTNEGIDSGNPGTWAINSSSISFSHTIRPGVAPYNGLGQQILYAASNTVSMGYSDDPEALTSAFSTSTLNSVRSGTFYAAMSVTGTSSVDIVHGWYFPHFYVLRETQNGPDWGSHYTHVYSSAYDAARRMNLTMAAQTIVAWQSAFSGMPDVIQDFVMNSFSNSRTLWLFGNGNVRQPENPAFENVDSIHNEAERRSPYFWYFPDVERRKLLAAGQYLFNATGDGMMAEEFALNGQSVGINRRMADVTSMFPCLLWEHAVLHNDTSLMTQMYTIVTSALAWMKNNIETAPLPMPFDLTETYDTPIEGINGYSVYSSMFALLGCKCISQIALWMNDAATSAAALQLYGTVQTATESTMWVASRQMYTGYVLPNGTYRYDRVQGLPYLSSDMFHAQIEAYWLGLDELLNLDRMQQTMPSMITALQTNYGLQFNRFEMLGLNWIMGDHATSILLTYWNQQSPSLAYKHITDQLTYFRDQRKDIWRNIAIINTNSGDYSGVLYYSWMMFFYKFVSAFSGQRVDLLEGTLSVTPNNGAFNSYGVAKVPIVWGGYLGYMVFSGTSVTWTSVFQDTESYTFSQVTLCGQSMSAPVVVHRGASPLTFRLQSSC